MDLMSFRELRRWFGEDTETRIERERLERLAARERGERPGTEALTIDFDTWHAEND